jgi:hypothetical protein
MLIKFLQRCFLYQMFRNLYGVECRTLFDLVAHAPEKKSVRIDNIFVDRTKRQKATSDMAFPQVCPTFLTR